MLKSHVLHNSTIKVKTGSCPTCDNAKKVPLIGGFCSSHYWQSRSKSPKKKEQKPIRKLSPRRAQQTAKYLKVRLEVLSEKPFCEVCGCAATECHHKGGRMEQKIFEKSNLLSVCRSCHQKIELNKEWALENGYSENRL